MLIRSQDKLGIIVFENIEKIISDINNKIVAYTETEGIILGKYSTEEKAIRVLDMIQEVYDDCNKEMYSTCGAYGYVKNRIFQMPQNSEVD